MFKFVYLGRLRDSVSLLTEIRESRHASRAFNRSVVCTKASETVTMTSQLDLKKCLEFVKQLSLQAGEIVKRGFEEEKDVQTKKNEWDVVTIFDRQVEEMFITALGKEYPDHKIIAEESASASKESLELTDAPTWLLDPIDGTMNFVHAFPCAAISVALAVCKEIVLGIVYNPMSAELYTAIKGEGAGLNGKPITVSNVTELRQALLVVEPFTLRPGVKNRDIQFGRFEAFVAETHGIRSTGSAAISLAYLARGAIDCFHLDALQPWDVAAGMLIVREAGGTVIDTKGGAYNFMKPNTVAAATEALATQMTKLIVETDLKTQRKRLQRT